MQIKICGITQVDQAIAIAQLGIDWLGFICVKASPRYVNAAQIQTILAAVKAQQTYLPSMPKGVGVFANATPQQIRATCKQAGLSVIQLHGSESPEFCQQLRSAFKAELSDHPPPQIWKVFRVQQTSDLAATASYATTVDGFLLDAYHPQLLGGTGHTLDWSKLQRFRPPVPWLLAGGLAPDNVKTAIATVQPAGVDVSSGVERSPGD
ncbi:MAG: phosphoribosylanthranilate isomerase [Cyanobacteria bacterium P01_H01_bin.121]